MRVFERSVMGQALNVRFTRKSGFQAQPSRVGAIRGSDAL